MDELLNLQDLALLFKVSPATARGYTLTPGFPACLRMSRKTLRWRRDEVLSWMERKAPRSARRRTPAYAGQPVQLPKEYV